MPNWSKKKTVFRRLEQVNLPISVQFHICAFKKKSQKIQIFLQFFRGKLFSKLRWCNAVFLFFYNQKWSYLEVQIVLYFILNISKFFSLIKYWSDIEFKLNAFQTFYYLTSAGFLKYKPVKNRKKKKEKKRHHRFTGLTPSSCRRFCMSFSSEKPIYQILLEN